MKFRIGIRPSPAIPVIQAVVGTGITAFSIHHFAETRLPSVLLVCVVAAAITLYNGIKFIRGMSPAGDERTASSVSLPHSIPLEDPVATKTGWDPAVGGGQRYRSHRLVQVDPNRLEFRGTLGGKLFSLVFLLIGLFAVGAAVYNLVFAPVAEVQSSIGLSFFGLAFAGVGFLMFPSTIVFDRRRNLYWESRYPLLGNGATEPRSGGVPLERIYAIQILTEMVWRKGTFYSHELNLVLEDGTRINVVDQSGLEELREEAATISHFLGKPVLEK